MKWSTTRLFLSGGSEISNSNSRLLTALGMPCSALNASKTFEPPLTKSTIKLGVKLGPKPFDLVGRRRRWE